MASYKLTPKLVPPKPEDIQTGDPAGFVRRGWAYYGLDDFARAADDFRAALEQDPHNLDTLYALALASKHAGAQTQAQNYFDQFLGLVPSIENHDRATMLRRLALGHINHMREGDWNLEREVWHRR